MCRPGRENSLGLASVNSAGGLWGTGDVPRYLVPGGPGWILAGGNTGMVCESQRRRGLWLRTGDWRQGL